MNFKRILCFFMLILLSFGINCRNTFASSSSLELTGNIPYSYRVKDMNGNLTVVNYGKYIYADNEIAFCVQPGVLVDENAVYEKSNFTHTQRTMMERIAYAGWHASEKSAEDYLSTQFYIWEVLGATIEDTSLTDYPLRREEIKKRVDLLFHKLPSFANQAFDIKATKSITLEDSNQIFSYYSLASKSNGLRITKENNHLVIAASNATASNAVVKFQLVDDAYHGTSMLYQSATSQSAVAFKVELNKTFQINLNVQHAHLKIHKVDKDKKGLDHVTFKIGKDKQFNDLLGTYTTDENGFIEINHIAPGTYYLQENDARNHLILDDTIHTLKVNAGEAFTYQIENQYRKLILEKQDEEGNVVPNVAFEVGTSSSMEEVLGIYQTGNNGRVEIDDIWNINYVYIREVNVPDHLQLDDTIHRVKLNPNADTTFVAVNDYQLMPIIIEKNDHKGLGLANVSFKLSRKSDMSEYIYFDEKLQESSKGISTITTNNQGKVTIYVKPGTYYIQECLASDNLILNHQIQKIVVPVGERITYEMINDYRKIILEKQDENGNPVPNVIFEVGTSSSMEKILGAFKTGSDGIVHVDDIWNLDYVYIREVKVPSHLQLDDTIHRVKLNPHANTVFVAINNYQFMPLHIEKKDQNGAGLANVSFKLSRNSDMSEYVYFDEHFYENSKGVSTITTDEQGKASVYVKPGTYYIQECLAPDHLILNTKIRKVVVPVGESITYEMINDYRKIILEKQDEEGNLVPNVTFEIGTSSSMEEILGTYKTGSDGKVEIDDRWNLRYLYIREVKVPDYLQLNDTIYRVKLNPNAETKYIAVNDYRKIILEKQDEEGNLVPNVTFEIGTSSSMEEILGTYKTGSDGKVEIDDKWNLRYLYVREVQVPAHLELNDTIYRIKLNPNDTTKYIAINKYKVEPVYIKKTDEEGHPLANVSFKISRKSDMSEYVYFDDQMRERHDGKGISTLTSSETGYCKFYLRAGIYYVKEILAPEGYMIDDTIHKIEVIPNETNMIRFQNQYTQLQIIKKNQKDQALGSISFEVAKDHEFKQILKFNDKGIRDENGSSIVHTNEKGEIVLKKLNSGIYYLREIAAPETIYFDRNKIYEVNLEKNQKAEILIHNRERTLRIIKKNDHDGLLEGAIYHLSKNEDMSNPLAFFDQHLSKEGEVQLKTDQNGEIILYGLENGVYYLQEIEPPKNYRLDSTIHRMELKANQDHEISLYNQGLFIEVHKTNHLQEPIEGVRFQLSTQKDFSHIVQEGTTDNKGLLFFDHLRAGTYYLKEVSTLDHYKIDQQIHKITLTKDAIKINVTNEERKGYIYKYDDHDQPIAGVQFAVYLDKECSQLHDTFITNKEGVISFIALKDHYYVKEVAAPTQYCIDDKVYEMNLEKNKDFILKLHNKVRTLTILKKDDDGNVRSHIKFGIYQDAACKKEIYVGESNEKGMITIPMEYDVVYVKELVTADDLVIDDTIHKVMMKKHQNYLLECINEQFHFYIQKVDEKGSPLKGAEFVILDESGTKEIVRFTSSEKAFDANMLKMNQSYILRELKAPLGYEKNADQHFIAQHDQILKVHNQTKTYRLIVEKVDTKQKLILADCSFGLYRDENCSDLVAQYHHDQGRFIFENLNAGTYYLKEIKAPSGYVISKDVIKIELLAEQEVTIQVVNQKVIPETGVDEHTLYQTQLMKWLAYSLLSIGCLILVGRRFYHSCQKE